tara:strand:+ start:6201 stop:6902 length:702 start_codon:yes stop_codon:yes gene_type:complete
LPKLTHSSLPKRLADSIQAQIISKDMGEGERLPTEPELMKSFGVSRTVVREAAALLMSRGIVEVRPRRGMTVKAPDGSGFAESLVAQLQMSRVSLDQLLEVRLMLESSMARIAAVNRTEDDLRLLDKNLSEMSSSVDRDHTIELDLAFHEAIAAATHNPFFIMVARPINDLLRLLYHDKLGYMSLRETTVFEHRQIVESVRKKNRSGAEECTRKHLVRVANSFHKLIAEKASH